MYLLYEHHKSPSNPDELLATDMLMTTWFPGKPGINFKSGYEKAFFEFTKKTFKDVHISKRAYADETKIWSFFGSSGASVYKTLKDSPLSALGLSFEQIDSLSDQVLSGYVRKNERAYAFDPADFFYTPEPPKSTALPRELLKEKLAVLMMIPPEHLEVLSAQNLKQAYRAAALALHPDRNSGDGAKMSEFNMLWQQWKALP